MPELGQLDYQKQIIICDILDDYFLQRYLSVCIL